MTCSAVGSFLLLCGLPLTPDDATACHSHTQRNAELVTAMAELQRKLTRERELAAAATRDAKATKARLAVALRAARAARWGPAAAVAGPSGDAGLGDAHSGEVLESPMVAPDSADDHRPLLDGDEDDMAAHGGPRTELDGRPATSAGLSRSQVYGGAPATAPAFPSARPGTRAGALRARRDEGLGETQPPSNGTLPDDPVTPEEGQPAVVAQLRGALREAHDECETLRRTVRQLRDQVAAAATSTAGDDDTLARLRSALSTAHAREEALRQRSEADAASLAAFKANHAAVLRQLEATHARLAAERAAVGRLTHQVEEGGRGAGGSGTSRVAELESQVEGLRAEHAALSAENKRLVDAALVAPNRAAELRAARAALAECARGKAQAEGSLADAKRILLAYGADLTTGGPPLPGEDYRAIRSDRDALKSAAAKLRVELEAAQEALNLLRAHPPPSAAPPPAAHSAALLPAVTDEQWQEAVEERARLGEQVATLDAQLVAKGKHIALLEAQVEDLRSEVAHLRALLALGDASAAEAQAQVEEQAARAAAERERAAAAVAAAAAAATAAAQVARQEAPPLSPPPPQQQPVRRDPFAMSDFEDVRGSAAAPPQSPPPAAAAAAEEEDVGGEEDDIPGLGPDENIAELHLERLSLEKSALRGESNPNTFLTVDFFEHETQATPLAAGWSVDLSQTFEFVVAVDNLFIQFMELDCLRLDLHVAHGLDFRTVGSAAWPLRRVLDVPRGQRAREAATSHDVQFRATSGEVVATLSLRMRLVRPVTEALRLYRALPAFDFGIGRISEAKREARMSFQFAGPRPMGAAGIGLGAAAESTVTVAIERVTLLPHAARAPALRNCAVAFDFLGTVFSEEDQRTGVACHTGDGQLRFGWRRAYNVAPTTAPAAWRALRSAVADNDGTAAVAFVLLADAQGQAPQEVGFARLTFASLMRDGDARDVDLVLTDEEGNDLGACTVSVLGSQALHAAAQA